MRVRWRTISGLALLGAAGVTIGLVAASNPIEPVRADNAVGDSTCLGCHTGLASFEQTAHRLTSTLPTRASIQGRFNPGENVLRTANPNLYFRMDSTATGFYETAVQGHAPDTSIRRERIDIVTGVRKGQSYLYWRGDRLYQHPVSNWAGFGWTNSPGYRDGVLNFDRPIYPRCLECHSSGFQSVADSNVLNRYQPTGTLLGITCEVCHGSGRDHVARERSVLAGLRPRAIVNPARLPRARQVDACALCHSGTAPLRTAPFSFVPGQQLEKRFDLSNPPDTGTVDVHGNQVALLERSVCFRSSQMTCATCHDVHREQRDVAALAGRCLTCHTLRSCGLFPRYGNALQGRCADCHMPLQPSRILVSNSLGHQLRPQVRTHWIKVYPEYQSP
ncbi:MAG TPA: multiheme c-type cytochrome [Gemmatimonadales bacterium]|nr:multiheme c-type cytochrome [Gemmatimonadales bacterium]